MNREDIISMAEQADGLESIGGYTFTSDGLHRFATLVAAAEREACVRLAEETKAPFTADLIRARGQA